jgi:UTP:GlnB (protein PII) uridylyltransferase
MKKQQVRLTRKNFTSASRIAGILSDHAQPHLEIKQILQDTRDTLYQAQSAGASSTQAQSAGASSTNIISLWTWFIDQLLIEIWHSVQKSESSSACCSLIAVGGYGRNELHPSSDIDLMILIDEELDDAFVETVKQFLR